jgi:mevalonate kinase
VAAAYLALRGVHLEPSRLLDISLDVERRQHGTPSGIDNAAVLLGGLLWAERDAEGRLDCRPLESSSPLLARLKVFHSGPPRESTGEVVASVRRRRDRDRSGVDRLLAEIESCTRQLRQELDRKTLPEQAVSLIRRCQAALEGLGVVPSSTQKLIRRIEAEGGAAKISGAGSLSGEGAGSILVYHPEVECIDRWSFLRTWTPLPVCFPAPGLLVEST